MLEQFRLKIQRVIILGLPFFGYSSEYFVESLHIFGGILMAKQLVEMRAEDF